MRKIKPPKLKIKGFQIKGLLSYLFTVILSSIIFALVLVSLPLTERVSSSATYDLVNKRDLYWAKEYVLELDTQSSIRENEDIERVKSVLHRRLRTLDVEKSSMYSYKEDGNTFLKISIQTSKNEDYIDNALKTPFIVNIVTRKTDVDFENPEDPIAAYLAENYEPTDITRKNFRNIYVTQLKNSENEYSYFALFKTWPWEKEWPIFVEDSAGQMIGVGIDGFVTPMQLPADKNLFAVPVSSTEEGYAQLTSILYNSGIMPISFTPVSEQALPVEVPEADYIKLTEGILIAIVLIYLYLFFIDKTPKDILIRSALSSVITVAVWIAYLKISETPVDIFLLAMQIITILAILRIISENKESRILVTVLLSLLSCVAIIFGYGYIKIFASDFLILMILSNLSLSFSNYYISNVKKSLKL